MPIVGILAIAFSWRTTLFRYREFPPAWGQAHYVGVGDGLGVVYLVVNSHNLYMAIDLTV